VMFRIVICEKRDFTGLISIIDYHWSTAHD